MQRLAGRVRWKGTAELGEGSGRQGCPDGGIGGGATATLGGLGMPCRRGGRLGSAGTAGLKRLLKRSQHTVVGQGGRPAVQAQRPAPAEARRPAGALAAAWHLSKPPTSGTPAHPLRAQGWTAARDRRDRAAPVSAHRYQVPTTSETRHSGRMFSAGGASRLDSLRSMPSASAGRQTGRQHQGGIGAAVAISWHTRCAAQTATGQGAGAGSADTEAAVSAALGTPVARPPGPASGGARAPPLRHKLMQHPVAACRRRPSPAPSPSSPGRSRPPGSRKKADPICSTRTCGWPCSCTTRMPSTERRSPSRAYLQRVCGCVCVGGVWVCVGGGGRGCPRRGAAPHTRSQPGHWTGTAAASKQATPAPHSAACLCQTGRPACPPCGSWCGSAGAGKGDSCHSPRRPVGALTSLSAAPALPECWCPSHAWAAWTRMCSCPPGGPPTAPSAPPCCRCSYCRGASSAPRSVAGAPNHEASSATWGARGEGGECPG